MFAAGAIPAYSAEFDPQPDTNPGVFLAADLHEGLAQPDGYWSSDDFLSSSATTWELEVEKEETDSSPSTRALFLDFSGTIVRAYQRDDRSLRSADVSGRVSSRAPPRA